MSVEYDYVVVGAGSAGCVLADRLSAVPGVTVALVEAGGSDDRIEVRMPAGFARLFKTERDWNFTTAAQAGLVGRELYWPRGRMIGGSSSMNGQMWVRGHRADYDGWNVPGWSYDEVLPYFLRSERRVGSNRGGVYGTGGPVRICELRSPNPATELFLRACEELGIVRLDELNGPSNEGCSPTPVTQHRGRRWSSADAYLRPAAGRPNLTVLTSSPVRSVLIEDGRAAGVVYGDGAVVRARAEVVLAAGTIGSPHLLMLSGVGPADELRAEGIEPVRDLPGVGGNLQDHLASGIFLHCRRPITLVGAESPGNLLRFLVGRTGKLTSNVGEAVAFIRTSPDEPAPDIELIFAPAPFINHGLTPPPGHGLTIASVLLQPESRGRVFLNGRDVVIDPGYLTAEADLRRQVAGLRKAGELFATEALAPLAGPPMDPYWGAGTDEELARWIRERSETLYHPVGTCRMGEDDDSVVDPALRVRGVAGLRVADASIMPVINRGHTQAPVVMIAEKAADLILADR
ncbi:choline dehydrogenase [Streptosporangium becharense]|uniref:Choline dehydrogenase n=1 Tax=Streptosporangium becharense TaxID=1816182 RepID=A0A7W9IL71_9ACTN|nr:GMC family oxidoreductase N-terminal domain-containing protein [Streptosporangium becharense]MBB2913175.1 choline dehydrogenase [Streptosporangium becharense]MBB5822158.1 choline dehydrogenase [Streptosporangium becharense]